MVPSMLVRLDSIPLTVNGKLDRKALPEAEFDYKDNYVAPRNELQRQICKIWSDVLGVGQDKIGIQDDFFRLGGDSIISIQLANKMKLSLGLTLTVKNIFTYKTIDDEAELIA